MTKIPREKPPCCRDAQGGFLVHEEACKFPLFWLDRQKTLFENHVLSGIRLSLNSCLRYCVGLVRGE